MVGVGSEDEVARVEHIENRCETIARHFLHVAFSFRDSREITTHLVVELTIDEILIAAEFHSVVATDALVEIATVIARFIERIALRNIEHASVCLILHHNAVGCCRCEILELYRIGETLVVEVTFINAPKVNDTDNA